VPALVDEVPAPNLADFVNAVGELKAAVLDGHSGRGVRQITAVDVGDVGHAPA
jgi:hypothetical protein